MAAPACPAVRCFLEAVARSAAAFSVPSLMPSTRRACFVLRCFLAPPGFPVRAVLSVFCRGGSPGYSPGPLRRSSAGQGLRAAWPGPLRQSSAGEGLQAAWLGPLRRSSVSGAVEQGACCSARCGCLGTVGLASGPRAPLPWALCSGVTLSAAARVLFVLRCFLAPPGFPVRAVLSVFCR